jgi:hypothetical protein
MKRSIPSFPQNIKGTFYCQKLCKHTQKRKQVYWSKWSLWRTHTVKTWAVVNQPTGRVNSIRAWAYPKPYQWLQAWDIWMGDSFLKPWAQCPIGIFSVGNYYLRLPRMMGISNGWSMVIEAGKWLVWVNPMGLYVVMGNHSDASGLTSRSPQSWWGQM